LSFTDRQTDRQIPFDSKYRVYAYHHTGNQSTVFVHRSRICLPRQVHAGRKSLVYSTAAANRGVKTIIATVQ